MARPPFEEPVLVARPPQEEGAAAKVVPVPKAVSLPADTETPTSFFGSKWGILTKLIGGIGFAAAMVGIGAFVGVVVIWMGRIELTSRIPPGGTPVEVSSSTHSEGDVSGPGTLPAKLSPSVPAPDTALKTSPAPAVGTDTPQIYNPDRSQILLEMELIRLERSKAEQALGQPSAGGLSPLARRVLEQWIWSATLAPGPHNGGGTSSSASGSPPSGEVSSPLKPNSQSHKGSASTSSGENRSSSPPQQDNTPTRMGGSLAKVPPGVPSHQQRLEHSKLTPSFRERWGITLDRPMPSGGSRPTASGDNKPSEIPQSGSSSFSGSSSGYSKPPANGHSKPPATPASGISPGVSSGNRSAGHGRVGDENDVRGGDEKSSSGVLSLWFGQTAPGGLSGAAHPKAANSGPGGPVARSAGPAVPVAGPVELSSTQWTELVEELRRHGIASRIGSAKLALLHRWPSQVDLVDPGLVDSVRESSYQAANRPVYAGKLYCLAERDGENQFTLELVAELPPGDPLPASPKAAGQSSDLPKPSTSAPAAAEISQRQKPGSYIFPAQVCQVGRWNVLTGHVPTPEGPNGGAIVCVGFLGKVESQPGSLGQIPLSESELRERAAAQCRYLEALLRARLPNSRIQLSLAAGKLFIHGQITSWSDQEEILALLHRRAIQHWKVHRVSAGPSLAGNSTDSGESAVVNMLQVAQVRLWVQMVEMAFAARASGPSGKPERTGSSGLGMLSAESRRWWELVGEATSGHQALVVPAVSPQQWEELEAGKLIRILWQQELISPSGRKETLTFDGLESISSDKAGLSEPSQRPSSPIAAPERRGAGQKAAASGHGEKDFELLSTRRSSQAACPAETQQCLVEILAQWTEQGAIRLEVAPTVKQQIQTRPAGQSGLLGQAHWWQIQALVEPGQWLLAPIAHLPETPKGSSVAAGSSLPVGSSGLVDSSVWVRRVLFISAEPLSHPADLPGEISGTKPRVSEIVENLVAVSGPFQKSPPASRPPVRKAQQASYEESPESSDASSLGKGAPSGSPQGLAEGGHAASSAPADRLEVLQEVLAKLFPHSQVHLRWEADRLVVEGQAANAAEASQILAVVRAEALPEQAGKVYLVNRLQVAAGAPIQYLLRVRFVRVHGTGLRQAAPKVKQDFPRLVPLAGAMLDLAERGGHLVLESHTTEQLPDLLVQAERLDLVRVVAQPTFGLLPGQPAEYLLPLSGGVSESSGPDTPPGQAEPTRGTAGAGYLFWRLTPQWTEQGRWQLEIILELGGNMTTGKEGSRIRLLAELDPGQSSAAAIPTEFYPGPGRLVVLTTPEMRTAPPKEGANALQKAFSSASDRGMSKHQYVGENAPIKGFSLDKSPDKSPSSSGHSIPNTSSGGDKPGSALPGPVAPSTPVAPWGLAGERGGSSAPKLENPSSFLGGAGSAGLGGSPGAGTGASQMERAEPARTVPPGRGLLPKLGQWFRAQKDGKSGSTPGYTVAESPELPPSQTLEIHVPEAPQPDSTGSRIIPRGVRPQPLR